MTDYKIHPGDCIDTLRAMPDNSVEAVVTDPPYGLSNHATADGIRGEGHVGVDVWGPL